MRLSHPKTILRRQSVEKLSSTKPVPDAKKVGDRCPLGYWLLVLCGEWMRAWSQRTGDYEGRSNLDPSTEHSMSISCEARPSF